MSFVIERLRPRSLRSRLIVWYSALVTLLFMALSLGTYAAQAQTLEDSARTSVMRESATVQAALSRNLQGATALPAHIAIPEIDAYTAPGITVEIVDRAGQPRYLSPSAGAQAPALLTPAIRNAIQAGQDLQTERRIEGQRVMVHVMPITDASGQILGAAVVARSLEDVDSSLTALRLLLGVATLLALALGLGGGYLLTRRALEPLTQIASTANSITRALNDERARAAATLRTRVPAVDDAAELGLLVTDVNRMLDALAAYDERQRRFIADASHELRTPLTTIRGNLEYLRRAPGSDPRENADALHDASAEAEQMAVLINDLLSLARAEESLAQATPQVPLEADALLMEVFQVARERARALGIAPEQVQVTDLAPAEILGDPAQLRQMLLILVDNAFKYAPGVLQLCLQCQQDRVEFVVSDRGPGIPASEAPHIFDRFYRASRARDREGSGLGLAIARTIAEQHQGTISVASKPGQGTTFTISLPAYFSKKNAVPAKIK